VTCHQEPAVDAENNWVVAWHETLWNHNRSFDVGTFNCFIPSSMLASYRVCLRVNTIRLFEDVEILKDGLVWPLISHLGDCELWLFLRRSEVVEQSDSLSC
jgi:hypothetical protein